MASQSSWTAEDYNDAQNILVWNGQECVNWARRVCEAQGLDPRTCDERRLLQLTGPQLLTLTAHELELTVGVFSAPFFRQCLDRIARLRPDVASFSKARSCEQQFNEGLEWSGLGPAKTTLYDLDPSAVPVGMCRGPDGYLTRQYLGTTSHNSWLEPQDLQNGYAAGFEEGDIFCSMPWTSTEPNMAPLSLPSAELPLLDALTIADVLDDNSCGNPGWEAQEQWGGGGVATTAQNFGANSKKIRRGCRGPVRDPPLLVPDYVLEDEKWFQLYTCDRNRVRRPEVWEYLLRLLQDPRTEGHLVEWVDRPRGVFKILQRQQVARMWRDHWHQAKRDTPVNYENFGKCLSYHYSTGVLEKVPEHFTYQLGQEVLQKLNSGHQW